MGVEAHRHPEHGRGDAVVRLGAEQQRPGGGTAGSFQRSVLDYLMENNLSKSKGVVRRTSSPSTTRTRSPMSASAPGPWATRRGRSTTARATRDLVQHVLMPLRFLAPELRGLKVKVAGEARYLGRRDSSPGAPRSPTRTGTKGAASTATYWGRRCRESAPVTKPPSRRSRCPRSKLCAPRLRLPPGRARPQGEGFPVGTACKFPAAVAFLSSQVRPSETEIDEATLANLKAHDIGGTWFGPAGLVVKAEAEKRDEGDDVAPAAPAPAETPVEEGVK